MMSPFLSVTAIDKDLGIRAESSGAEDSDDIDIV